MVQPVLWATKLLPVDGRVFSVLEAEKASALGRRPELGWFASLRLSPGIGSVGTVGSAPSHFLLLVSLFVYYTA